MNYLCIHQNFPGQFASLAPALAADPANAVVALACRQGRPETWQGVRVLPYFPATGSAPDVHPWVRSFETQIIRAQACFEAALELRAQGFSPDVILAHPGWGESLFVKEVWPQARLGIYCEYYYQAVGADIGFDPECYPADAATACRLRLKNLMTDMHCSLADGGLSPTAWQAGAFPEPLRSRISVVHEGVDTDLLAPDPEVSLTLNGDIVLTRADEVVTFVNRELEPYRGVHVFLRALPELLRRRPRARVILVGGDDVGYGDRPAAIASWKEHFLAPLRGSIPESDWSRVHFVGKIPYAVFIQLLQLSTVHVYLTYPFVLSRSLLEAMSVGCAVVGSDTAPVREVVRHDENGRLVDFFDRAGLVREICALLDDAALRQRLGEGARRTVLADYDLRTVCLPRQLAWVHGLAAGPGGIAPGSGQP